MDRQIGGYVLEEKLGEGGMGTVFRARHPSVPGRSVALKVLRTSGGAPPSAAAVARFQREMLALARVQHPNVVRILGGSLDPPTPFYAMELVSGKPLDDLLTRGGFEPKRAVAIVRGVADAIAAAHAQGILHRDLKPSNVLIEPNDRPRVCDFGVALVDEAERLTRTGTFVGSVGFAAPEQLAGQAHQADERTDVYGLGAVLWATLVGRGPFDHKLEAGFPRLLGDAVKAPSREVKGIPRELDAVVLRALEEAPHKRYASAAAFRDELDRWSRGEAVLAFESSAMFRAALTVRSSRSARALALVAIAAIVGAVTVLVAQRTIRASRVRALIARANDPAVKTTELRETLDALERERAAATVLERVRESLSVRELDELLAAASVRARPGDPPPFAALDAAAAAALRAPERVSLVGEREGFALGDALLDARDELSTELATDHAKASKPKNAPIAHGPALLERALGLVRATLARAPADPSARALRAYVALTRLEAPRRPLGPGTLGLEAATAPDLLSDLEAARDLKGAPGARAAWLLVDLLLAARNKEGLERALDVARQRFPDAPARAGLETALATPLTAEGFLTLTKAFATAGQAQPASFVLSRFFARQGQPETAEHPEVAFDSHALERILIAEPVSPEPPYRDDTPAAPTINEFQRVRMTTLGETHATRAPKLVELAKQGLRQDVHHPLVFRMPNEPCFGRLSQGVFGVLASAGSMAEVYGVADEFSRGMREAERSVTESGLRVHTIRWETGSGLAGCEEFDRRLAEDLAGDDLVATAVASGLAQAELDLAASAARGLRRLDELESDPPEDPVERARIAFEALLEIEDYGRLRPAAARLFRARLRAVALPAPLGPALARLDLARFDRELRQTGHAPPAPMWTDRLALIAFKSATLAATLPGAEAIERDAFDLGVHFSREWAMRAGPEQADVELNRLAQIIAISPLYRGIKASEASRRSALTPTAEDRTRLLRRYVYRPPPWHLAGKSDATPEIPTRDAIMTSARFPATLAPDEVGEGEVVFRNAGSATWTDSSYRLGAKREVEGDAGHFLAHSKSTIRVFLPNAAPVPPGKEARFIFRIVAPPEPRDYHLEFQMMDENVEWFGDVATATIVVAPH